MPQIELYDACNTAYRIDTLDWDKIRAWLAEWLPRLRCPDIALRVRVIPLFTYPAEGGREVPDWNADSRFFDPFVIPDTVDEAMAAISQRRLDIEQAKRDGKKWL
jgi:hypothetical protein